VNNASEVVCFLLFSYDQVLQPLYVAALICPPGELPPGSAEKIGYKTKDAEIRPKVIWPHAITITTLLFISREWVTE